MNAHDQLLIASAILGVGIITFCVCLPLIYRKVPMNRFYGIRIPQSFVSAERWYDINAYGGRLLVRWSCLIMAIGLAGFFGTVALLPALCDHRCGPRSRQYACSAGSDYPLGESDPSDLTSRCSRRLAGVMKG